MNLDFRYIKQMAEQFRKGDNLQEIARRFGSNKVDVAKGLKVYMGDEYDVVAACHRPSLEKKNV